MATIPTIQLFRNSIIKTGRQAAINSLEDQKAFVPDGGLILARYSINGGEDNVKTLLGIVRNGGGTEAQLTIIDVEGAAENVQDAIKKISGETASQEGKFISAITQTNGVVNVEFGGVAAANVSVADEGNIFTATTVEGVLSEIQNYIGTGGTVEEQITNAINALDSSATSTNNYFDVTVAQEHGKITSLTVTNKDIASASLLGTTSDTKDNETAFGYIAKEVADRTAAINALSTSSTVTLEDAAGTESGVLKVYTIKQGGTSVGTINIPKDLVVTSGSVVKGNWNDGTFTEEESGSGTALKLVIANQEAPVYINTLDLVKDHTAGSGIAISDTNEISVKRDSTSERFLTVGADGVKLDGVQNAINQAAASATTKVKLADGADKITLTSSTADDGSVTYIIGQNDIASASALTAETNARESADTALSNRLGDGVTSSSTATAQFAALSGQIASINATIDSLDATVVSSSGTSTTEAIKIVQTDGKLVSITLGAFDCGTYSE